MTMKTNKFLLCFALALLSLGNAARAQEQEMKDFPLVKLQSLDKVTARTMTFEARVGETVKFGSLYIKVQSCRKSPPIAQPESAAFLQIWEPQNPEQKNGTLQSKWVFSGWMFASSPGLSFMDHPIYDVWVLDCLSEKGETTDADFEEQAHEDEGVVQDDQVPAQPEDTTHQTPADQNTPIESEELPAQE